MEILNYATTSEIIGQSVTDSLGHDYGTLIDVLFSPEHRQAVIAIVSTEDMDQSTIVLPFQALRINPNTQHITVEIDKQTIQDAPQVDLNLLRKGNRDELINIYNYYGYQNIWQSESSPAPSEKPYRSGEDTGERHPSNEGSYEITKQYPGQENSNFQEEVDYDKIKGLPKQDRQSKPKGQQQKSNKESKH